MVDGELNPGAGATTAPASALQQLRIRGGRGLPGSRVWGPRRFSPYCASHLVLADFNDLASKRPEVAAEWHPARNGDLRPDAIAP